MKAPPMGRPLRALILLGALACARRSELIGAVILADAGRDADPDTGDTGAAETPAACPFPEPALPTVPEPVWNCGPGCFAEPGAPDPTVFATAAPDDPGRAPALVYPAAGSVHPTNLARITLQWTRAPGAVQSGFRVEIGPRPGGAPFRFYLPYRTDGAESVPTPLALEDVAYAAPPEHWRFIARELAGRDVTLTLAAYDPSTARIAVAPAVPLRFTAGPVEAAIVYLTLLGLADGVPAGSLRRASIGGEAAPLVPARSAANARDCAGCHSLSVDGARLAFAATYSGELTVTETPAPGAPLVASGPTDVGNAFAPALSPKGDLVLARARDGRVHLYQPDGTSIDSRSDADLGGHIEYPTFTPTGDEIVAGRSSLAGPAKPALTTEAELVTLPIRAGRIGAPVVLHAEPGKLLAYPTVSPDGAWIVFVARAAGTLAENNPGSELRMLARRDATRVITLGRTLEANVATTWPRFLPTPQAACRRLYLVFQSRRNYGLLLRQERLAAEPLAQLWLSELDVDAADPLSPPIWLPFQDPNNKNILPATARR
jgi:hypothetical protein